MFGANPNINQYKQMSLETGAAAANPVELIVMLYDGAIVAGRSAISYIDQKDYKNKSEYIFKAIRIIQVGLRMSLDREVGGEIALNLDALYIYMTNQLVKGNIDNDKAPIQEVIKLLAELKEAWQQISKTEAANATLNKPAMADVENAAYAEKV